MAWKNIKQRSFADDLIELHSAVEELDDVHDLINWSRIENLLSHIHTKVQGEKAWPPLMMYKALLLQSWYCLSDPALEKQLARDLLFRRFVGLSLSERIPDHSTFWRFRNLLEELQLNEDLLEEINLQLGDKGLLIRSGEISIIDASAIKTKNNRPNKVKMGKTPKIKKLPTMLRMALMVSVKPPMDSKPISMLRKMVTSSVLTLPQAMFMIQIFLNRC